ncbi:CLUMA_CG003202, isoform A [Clunio marinus]|uniref:NADH dehydrogenase [ubiquinone] 1 subunit C2 n=1 Tax=Clunio marinus TaxID=568069 RepID=A0A1J1HN34_9DIPT|nr:CLUMA_CG003202, isoform A [Clunio marinus]
MTHWAIETLTPDPNRQQSILSKYFNPVVCGIIGFGAMCAINYGTRRPILSGIQMHALAAAVGVGIGVAGDKYGGERYSERDAVLKHYIELHPEDFPEPERKKFSQILEPWVPIR